MKVNIYILNMLERFNPFKTDSQFVFSPDGKDGGQQPTDESPADKEPGIVPQASEPDPNTPYTPPAGTEDVGVI